jgi:hypothetical protein
MLRQVSVWLCSFVIRKKGGPYPTHWGLGASVGGFQTGGKIGASFPCFFFGLDDDDFSLAVCVPWLTVLLCTF